MKEEGESGRMKRMEWPHRSQGRVSPSREKPASNTALPTDQMTFRPTKSLLALSMRNW